MNSGIVRVCAIVAGLTIVVSGCSSAAGTLLPTATQTIRWEEWISTPPQWSISAPSDWHHGSDGKTAWWVGPAGGEVDLTVGSESAQLAMTMADFVSLRRTAIQAQRDAKILDVRDDSVGQWTSTRISYTVTQTTNGRTVFHIDELFIVRENGAYIISWLSNKVSDPQDASLFKAFLDQFQVVSPTPSPS